MSGNFGRPAKAGEGTILAVPGHAIFGSFEGGLDLDLVWPRLSQGMLPLGCLGRTVGAEVVGWMHWNELYHSHLD